MALLLTPCPGQEAARRPSASQVKVAAAARDRAGAPVSPPTPASAWTLLAGWLVLPGSVVATLVLPRRVEGGGVLV